MNKKMKKDFEELIKKYNGKWELKDFDRLLLDWVLESKIIVDTGAKKSRFSKRIFWIYKPELFKKLEKRSESAVKSNSDLVFDDRRINVTLNKIKIPSYLKNKGGAWIIKNRVRRNKKRKIN